MEINTESTFVTPIQNDRMLNAFANILKRRKQAQIEPIQDYINQRPSDQVEQIYQEEQINNSEDDKESLFSEDFYIELSYEEQSQIHTNQKSVTKKRGIQCNYPTKTAGKSLQIDQDGQTSQQKKIKKSSKKLTKPRINKSKTEELNILSQYLVPDHKSDDNVLGRLQEISFEINISIAQIVPQQAKCEVQPKKVSIQLMKALKMSQAKCKEPVIPVKKTDNQKVQQLQQIEIVIEIQQLEEYVPKFGNKGLIIQTPKPQSQTIDETRSQRDLSKPQNLSCWTLLQLVRELKKYHLINEKLFQEFKCNHRPKQDIRDYVYMFKNGILHQFDFDKIKFTLLDHRRMSQLLINLYPKHYYTGKVHSTDPNAAPFLKSLYEMNGEEYYRLFTKIDKISKIKWWSKILITQEDNLIVNSNERRITQKKAEQADQAIQEIISSYLPKNREGKVLNGPNNIFQIDLDDVNTGQLSDKGVSHIEKRSKQKEKEIQLGKIRNMVVNNFGKDRRITDTNEDDEGRFGHRKIKFY